MPEKRRLAEVVEMLEERRTRARLQSQQKAAGLVPDDDEEYGSDASYESTIDYSEEDAAYITSQIPPTRPSFSLPLEQTDRSSQLQEKLTSFLSQIEQSNELLKSEGVKSIEDVDEDEHHIVMELGLGVLEQKSKEKQQQQQQDTTSNESETSSSNDDADDDDDDDQDDDDTPTGSLRTDALLGASMEAQPDEDSSHLDSLLGRETGQRKAMIKEVG